jgi:signal peptidase II
MTEMAQSTAGRPGRFFLLGFILIAALIFADQYSKWWVIEHMLRTGNEPRLFKDWFMTLQPVSFFLDQRETYNIVSLTPFLNFVMVWNTGVSFGMFNSDSELVKVLLIGVALFISLLMMIWLSLTSRGLVSAAIILIVSGAIGNVFDRVRFGAVADFIDFHVAGLHWPAFNVADSGIVLGGILLILHAARNKNDHLLLG